MLWCEDYPPETCGSLFQSRKGQCFLIPPTVLSNRPFEFLHRPELGMDGPMPSLFRSNGPRTSHIIRICLKDIVLPFSVRPPNRMDGREVEDVKTHPRDLGKNLLAILERSVLPRARRKGSWKKFIPGAEEGPLSFDHHRQFLPIEGSKSPVGVSAH